MDYCGQPRREAIGCRSRGFLDRGLQLGRRGPVAEPLVILPPLILPIRSSVLSDVGTFGYLSANTITVLCHQK